MDKHFSAISENEKIPNAAKSIIDKYFPEIIFDNDQVQKFQVGYFLIPDNDLQLLYDSKKYSNAFMKNEMYFTFSGKRFFKFFIFPGQEEHFKNLKNSYRYITQDQSEYFATSLKPEGLMVLWNKNNLESTPFDFRALNDFDLTIDQPRFPASNKTTAERSIIVTFSKGPYKNLGQEITNLLN